MELSEQVHDLLNRIKLISRPSEASLHSETINVPNDCEIVLNQNDIINVDEIDFSNDETWLYASSGDSNVKDLNRWLYEEVTPKSVEPHNNHMSLIRAISDNKKIDTRTFTRPKKKYTRPSIEKFHEELFDEKHIDDKLTQEIENYLSSSQSSSDVLTASIKEDANNRFCTPMRALHFDLNQPMSGSIFDKILSNAPDIDSFQNMSPPSLVNSMCSSTFTNLMENSFIKNDPVLREIRDADYSNEILTQDVDPPLYQSFTESCSSLNSDSAENFLRRTLPTLNGTLQDKDATLQNSDCAESGNNSMFSKNSGNDLNTIYDGQGEPHNFNCTFKKNKSRDFSYSKNLEDSDSQIEGNLNNTFKRNLTKDISCDMSSSNNSDIQCDGGNVNGTFKKPKNNEVNAVDLDSTYIAALTAYNKESSESTITDVYFNTAMSGSTPPKNQPFDNIHSENIDPNTTVNIAPTPTKPLTQNATFRKGTKINSTFNKVPNNNTYVNDLSNELNRTVSLVNQLDSSPPNCQIDTKIITYNIKDDNKEEDVLSTTYSQDAINRAVELSRNSGGYVTGSTDSLDHMSSLSNSSRGSNRMLNMAEVDAIVEFQERSLQVMSTPKPAKSMCKLFENHFISPIVRQKEHVSDSDLSSTDDFMTVHSTLSKVSSNHSEKNLPVLDREVKSLSGLKTVSDLKLKPRSINTISKPDSSTKMLKGSYTNLQSVGSNIKGSYTNLKAMGGTLRGSYTSLKPISLNLPVITSEPPSAEMNITRTITGTRSDDDFKVPTVPELQIKPSSAPPTSIVRPQARISSLPRPVGTGIPRPVSRIPGPRTSRPQTSRSTSRPVSKISDGYY